LRQFKTITAAARIDETTIKLAFENEHCIFFHLQRAHPDIWIQPDIRAPKTFLAPFDRVLHKYLNRSTIVAVNLINDDKLLRISVENSGSYKREFYHLQLEYTGKYTNAIILDDQEIVIEALRHVDAFSSSRIVKVGHALSLPPKPNYTPKPYPIDDVEQFLRQRFTAFEAQQLATLKEQKVAFLQKKLKKVQKELHTLSDEALLEQQSQEAQLLGQILLTNLHRLKPYDTTITLDDFEGNPQRITLPKNIHAVHLFSEHFFKRAKKLRQKAQYQHKEREALTQKEAFFKHFIQSVQHAPTLHALSILFSAPKQKNKTTEHHGVESFYIQSYKIQLGKNERGNIFLLQQAKARDIWLHLKQRASTHVIITTDKQQVPHSVIEEAAKLCVQFSVEHGGNYEVDYTPRRELNITHGAHLLYTKYKTLTVTI